MKRSLLDNPMVKAEQSTRQTQLCDMFRNTSFQDLVAMSTASKVILDLYYKHRVAIGEE